MIIEIYNFGIIKKFKFDTDKDFTMIFGKNNTGKSYAISAIYLIIKNLINIDDLSIFKYALHFIELEEFLTNLYKKIQENKKIDISKDLETKISKLLTIIFLNNLEESFKNTFESIPSIQNHLTKDSFKIKIKDKLISFDIIIINKHLQINNLQILKRIILNYSKRNLSSKYEKNNIKIYSSNDEEKFIEKILNLILDISYSLSKNLKEKIKNIYYLPASRSGLYQALSAFGQIIVELSKSRNFTSKKIELPSISEPLGDYFLELSNIKVKKQAIENNITKIALDIEKDILNGKVEYDKNTKKIIFMPNNTNLKLDLSYTSSMVSELSPVISYLRYIVNYKSVDILKTFRLKKVDNKNAKAFIIIEEPEAHLHPEVQIKLLEYFVKLSQYDVKFIITTHSNYMFNKLNNLILAGKIDNSKILSLLFDLKKEGTESVEEIIDGFGIEDKNFIQVSEYLYDEKLKLIDNLNKD